MLDTLTIDLADKVATLKEKARLYGKAISLEASLKSDVEFAQSDLLQEISAAVGSWSEIDLSMAKQTVEQFSQSVNRKMAKRNAEHRRAAVLKAFSEIGYEIRDELETAWVQDRRVVVRKSAQLDYGVELSGSAENGHLQVRAVRFSSHDSQQNSRRDDEIETVWCSEFGELKKALAENGGEMTIEKAKAIGESPVKVVQVVSSGKRDRATSKLLTRKRPKK